MKKIGFLLLFVLSTIFLHGCAKSSEHHQISADPIPSKATMISQNIIPGGYLYRNLDLSKASDKEEYEQLQNNKNLILEYQTKTSSAVNKFIDMIHQDLLEACKHYGTTYETNTGTYYERDVCVDRYISKLYYKLGIIDKMGGYFERKSSINLNFLHFFNHLWIPIFCFKCQNTASNEFVVVGSCIFSFRNS